MPKPKRKKKKKVVARATTAKRVAFHEAGHALIDLIEGVRFDSVSIESMDTVVNGVRFRGTVGIEWSAEAAEIFREAYTADEPRLDLMRGCIAGPVAEAVFVGETDAETRVGAENDIKQATSLLMCRGSTATVVDGGVVMTPAPDANHEVANAMLAKEWTDLVAYFRGPGKVPLCALVLKLMEHKTLTYEEVEAVVEDARVNPAFAE